MDATEIDFGPDLQHPLLYLTGAVKLYGEAALRGWLEEAIRPVNDGDAEFKAAAARAGLVLLTEDK